jgi:thioredoxin reductase (NADPH)
MTNSNPKTLDVAIIGAGPAALTAALYLARAGLTVAAFDRSAIGGQLAAIDRIDNYPGFPDGISGPALAAAFRTQAENFGAAFRLVAVTAIKPLKSGFRLITDAGPIKSKAVLVATGTAPKPLNIPGESDFRGRGVHTCAACDGAFYRDQSITVIGGANSAVQETLYLSNIVSHINLIVRSTLKADQILLNSLQKLINAHKVTLYKNAHPEKIQGDTAVTALTIRQNNISKTLETKAVFIFTGHTPNTALLEPHLLLTAAGYIPTDQNHMTTLPGLFAAGDVRANTPKQVATAVGEGAAAALHLHAYLTQK